MNEYSTEKFLPQYEHITMLELLSDSELSQLKKKRNQFEVSIKSANDVKPFIEYIKYELALMKKFKQANYNNDNDRRALDRALSVNVRQIFKQAIKRFPENRNLWTHYLEFTKLKFANTLSNVYQDMLAFHHKKEDYIEAVKQSMETQNYFLAFNFLIQGINKHENAKELPLLYIECTLLRSENAGSDKHREMALEEASKLYEKHIKGWPDHLVYIDLLNQIQNIKYSHSFQEEILTYILKVFPAHAEVWDMMANRHLNGLFFKDNEKRVPDDIPFETRLRHALTIYDKSLQIVGDQYKRKMYDLYLNKLEELDALTNISQNCYKNIRYSYSQTLISGFNEDLLSELQFMHYLKLRIFHKEKYQKEIKEILEKGKKLYPCSMAFYEIALKYYHDVKDYESLSNLFKHAVSHNEKDAVELYKFLCNIYIVNNEDKDRILKAMMEAIESNNKKLSANFQPYILEYYSLKHDNSKVREIYNQILNSKTTVTLSLDFFTTMIKLEKCHLDLDHAFIKNCFERATQLFGRDNPKIWIEYIKYCWECGKPSEANGVKNRAMEAMKTNLENIKNFELEFNILRNNHGQ